MDFDLIAIFLFTLCAIIAIVFGLFALLEASSSNDIPNEEPIKQVCLITDGNNVWTTNIRIDMELVGVNVGQNGDFKCVDLNPVIKLEKQEVN